MRFSISAIRRTWLRRTVLVLTFPVLLPLFAVTGMIAMVWQYLDDVVEIWTTDADYPIK